MRFILLTAAALAAAVAPALAAQQPARHMVQVRGDTVKDVYRYVPASVTARAGDIVVFRVKGDGKHSISFERNLPAEARSALNASMPNRVGELSGPLISDGQEYVMTLSRSLPAGRYRFYCLPHRAYDEAGWLVVQK